MLCIISTGDRMKQSQDFDNLAKKFGALNNTTKLSILSLLSEEGTKSVTDVSKSLNINFSTAHKYLEHLEDAGLVKSKQETQSRLKRMFTIQDFSISLTPKNITAPQKVQKRGTFKIVTERGTTEIFDENKFIKKYLERGLPQSVVEAGCKYIRRHAYNGITSLELRHLFRIFLKQNIDLINQTMFSLDKEGVHSRTFRNILKLLHPTALDQHMKGDIFISNLRYPILRNCIIDVRGVALHGVDGHLAKNLGELLKQILNLIDKAESDVNSIYTLGNFNYFIAPLASKGNPIDVMNSLTDFIDNLQSKKCSVYIELDLGNTPKFLRTVPADYYMTPYMDNTSSKKMGYLQFFNTAEKIAKIVTEILDRGSGAHNVIPIFKIWNPKNVDIDFTNLKHFYMANMLAHGEQDNISFAGRLNRFDGVWKGWFGTNRVGEMQNITLNLPRLAKSSTSVESFFKKLDKLVNDVVEYQLNMSEMAVANFVRNHDISIESVRRMKWSYIRTNDSLYSISLIGLNEAVYMLSGKSLLNNPDLGEEILVRCKNSIEQKKPRIRISLKEEVNPLIADRFYYLDSLEGKHKVKSYSAGVGCKDLKVASIMDKHLSGGHCITIPKRKFNLKSLLNSNILLFRVSGFVK